eukprot:SAG31_NODE_29099_length_400_cov_2.039867_1_plen_71_part_10
MEAKNSALAAGSIPRHPAHRRHRAAIERKAPPDGQSSACWDAPLAAAAAGRRLRCGGGRYPIIHNPHILKY